jgi:endonuclease VIII
VPEGDTVYRAAHALDRALTGHRLTVSDFRVPSFATIDLTGGTVVRTLSRGKHLLTRIDHDRAWTLHTHLKMEGSWHIYATATSGAGRARRYASSWASRDGRRSASRWASSRSWSRQEEAALTAHLGPDLLGPDWDADHALARLRSEPERPIGQALLDQRNLAGIGNMYMAELCFTSGIHPATTVTQVPDLPRLVNRARLMLEANKERAIQSTTGDLRPRERMWVYRRDKSPCRRCGTPILVDMLGEPGRERAAYWCPSCQPAL